MRNRKLIVIIVLLGVIFLPFMSRASIRPVLAEEDEPPTESKQEVISQEVLTIDNLQEIQGDMQPIEAVDTDPVDPSLGMDPAEFTLETPEHPGFDGGNQGAPSTTNELGNSIESLNYNPVTGLNLLDNFNRLDGALGPDWTEHNGSFSISGEVVSGGAKARATYDGYSGQGDSAEADVTVNGPGLQYTGLLLNYGAGVSNLFIKVQQDDVSGLFDHAACYTGNQGPSFGLGYFTLDTPFYSAHMKATRVGDTVTLIFSNIDGGTQPSQTYICDGAPPREGNGVGINGWNGIAYIDNFAVRGGCEWDMHDNGPMVTHEGVGYDGADVSALQENTLGMITLGWGSQYSYGYRLAEDFEVTDPGGWQVNALTIPAFQIGSTTTPTITGLYYQIWDGSPDNPGSNVVFGDLVTNRLISTVWTGIYRTTDANISNTDMPIMANTASAGVFLPPGTYWLDWMIDGSLTSGPWVPPITILGQTTTGNAMQYVTGWIPLLDNGTATPQGFPFLIHGCKDHVLWDQPVSSNSPTDYYASQVFIDPGYEDFTCTIADDFYVSQPWSVESLYFPGGWWSNNNIAHATAVDVGIHEDAGGIPGPSFLLLSLPINSPYVTLYLNAHGTPGDLMVKLPYPIVLQPGHYWLSFSPYLNYSLYSQWGRAHSDTSNLYRALWINPGGGWGYGTGWQDWAITGAYKYDAAFRISGSFKNYLPLNNK